MGALAFGLALAIAVPWYAAKGIHMLPVSVPGLWAGVTVAGACYGLLGGLAWVQIVEVGLLQHFVPALAKWLPTGAAVAITTSVRRTSCCRGAWPHSCSPAGRWRWSPPG